MRAITLMLAVLGALAGAACGGAQGRAAWPDVASTDRSADDLGLPSAAPAPGEESPSPEEADPSAEQAGAETPVAG